MGQTGLIFIKEHINVLPLAKIGRGFHIFFSDITTSILVAQKHLLTSTSTTYLLETKKAFKESKDN